MHLFLLLLSASAVYADIYMHNPRGSNNRLDEETRERKNANRMFDSQNNNRGGYNVGEDEIMYYYSGSILPIQWANQHSCGNENNNCEIVIQYMCGDNVRDGTTTKRIPEFNGGCINKNCNEDERFGMHESYQNYANCRARERNAGLFTADQNPDQANRGRAIHTRQNQNGDRRGYECPEEKDYYPYWHPTPWRDIAVFTNDVSRCDYYRAESENVKSRFYCHLDDAVLAKVHQRRSIVLPNNKDDCENFYFPSKTNRNAVRGEWRESPAHGIEAPDCLQSPYNRDNHQGNKPGGYLNMYNWTIPNLDAQTCVLRIRYNISTMDYDGWAVSAADGKELNLANEYGFGTADEADERGYVLAQNPQVKLFEGLDVELEVNLNTNQFGRTFQDRSHTFAIMPRPQEISQNRKIYNVNVRGKRGNIVQVFPALEYDFVPDTLEIKRGDYVHFQWTGSDSNPDNNAGQGQAGTDRSNIVVMDKADHLRLANRHRGHWSTNFPATIQDAFLGLNEDDKNSLATLDTNNDADLNKASAYFDLGPRAVTGPGVYHYICTRNNAFSNRSQKGRVIVI